MKLAFLIPILVLTGSALAAAPTTAPSGGAIEVPWVQVNDDRSVQTIYSDSLIDIVFFIKDTAGGQGKVSYSVELYTLDGKSPIVLVSGEDKYNGTGVPVRWSQTRKRDWSGNAIPEGTYKLRVVLTESVPIPGLPRTVTRVWWQKYQNDNSKGILIFKSVSTPLPEQTPALSTEQRIASARTEDERNKLCEEYEKEVEGILAQAKKSGDYTEKGYQLALSAKAAVIREYCVSMVNIDQMGRLRVEYNRLSDFYEYRGMGDSTWGTRYINWVGSESDMIGASDLSNQQMDDLATGIGAVLSCGQLSACTVSEICLGKCNAEKCVDIFYENRDEIELACKNNGLLLQLQEEEKISKNQAFLTDAERLEILDGIGIDFETEKKYPLALDSYLNILKFDLDHPEYETDPSIQKTVAHAAEGVKRLSALSLQNKDYAQCMAGLTDTLEGVFTWTNIALIGGTIILKLALTAATGGAGGALMLADLGVSGVFGGIMLKGIYDNVKNRPPEMSAARHYCTIAGYGILFAIVVAGSLKPAKATIARAKLDGLMKGSLTKGQLDAMNYYQVQARSLQGTLAGAADGTGLSKLKPSYLVGLTAGGLTRRLAEIPSLRKYFPGLKEIDKIAKKLEASRRLPAEMLKDPVALRAGFDLEISSLRSAFEKLEAQMKALNAPILKGKKLTPSQYQKILKLMGDYRDFASKESRLSRKYDVPKDSPAEVLEVSRGIADELTAETMFKQAKSQAAILKELVDNHISSTLVLSADAVFAAKTLAARISAIEAEYSSLRGTWGDQVEYRLKLAKEARQLRDQIDALKDPKLRELLEKDGTIAKAAALVAKIRLPADEAGEVIIAALRNARTRAAWAGAVDILQAQGYLKKVAKDLGYKSEDAFALDLKLVKNDAATTLDRIMTAAEAKPEYGDMLMFGRGEYERIILPQAEIAAPKLAAQVAKLVKGKSYSTKWVNAVNKLQSEGKLNLLARELEVPVAELAEVLRYDSKSILQQIETGAGENAVFAQFVFDAQAGLR